MSHKMLRPFISKVSVLGYLPLLHPNKIIKSITITISYSKDYIFGVNCSILMYI